MKALLHNIKSRLFFLMVLQAIASSSMATPIGITLDSPLSIFRSSAEQGVSYDAAAGRLTIEATPLAIQLAANNPLLAFDTATFSIGLSVDHLGNFTGDPSTDEFQMYGTLNTGNTIYSGLLLSGQILNFGHQDITSTVDYMDLLFTPTAGELAHYYGNTHFGVVVVMENSTFNGSFTENFYSNPIKGKIGAVAYTEAHITAVPEPSTLLLFLIGLMPLVKKYTC